MAGECYRAFFLHMSLPILMRYLLRFTQREVGFFKCECAALNGNVNSGCFIETVYVRAPAVPTSSAFGVFLSVTM